MLLRTGLLCVLLAAVACSPPSQPAPDSGSPPDTEATLPSQTTAIVDGPIRGALPDGTIYDVILEPRADEEVTEVTAGLLVDPAEEMAEVSFLPDDDRPTGWHGEIYRLRDAAWTVEIRFPPSALEALAPDGRRRVEESVRLSTHLGLPVMELAPPLLWAGDEAAPMRVSYETFAVRRGCPGPAVACNPTHAVGVIPLEEISPDAPVWSAEAEVVSYSLRPPTDPHYYDPGPLTGRSGHDLLWTGEEMIVWGGTGPLRMDGAAFDPDTGDWRMLPSVPLDDDQPTRAVWAEDRMMVVSAEATVAYHPGDENWTRLGEGLEPPAEPGQLAWTGDEVMVWDDGGVRAFRPDAGSWLELPSPGPMPAALRMEDRRLYAIGGEACPERVISEWTGESWREVSAVPPPEQSCPPPAQTAVVGDRFVVWHGVEHPTHVYQPSDDRWAEMAPVPLPPLDRPLGPVDMGDRFLVPGNQEGAIFDPADDRWTPVDLPGHGRAGTTVWTGTEVLMWDRCCYEPDDVDAWRWTPPD